MRLVNDVADYPDLQVNWSSEHSWKGLAIGPKVALMQKEVLVYFSVGWHTV